MKEICTKFQLTDTEIVEIENQKKYYEHPRAIAIEALKIVQKKRGWISDPVIYAISKIININPSELDGIATFYSQIFRKPVGRNVIRYCDSSVCYVNGYKLIKIALEKCLKIKIGQTTKDYKFTLLPVCCLGNCDQGPTMMINEKTYSKLTPESIPYLLELYK
ncbi:NADH-quinone oxidoreductase subunit NuoE [Buchnera aphidicola (Muscaphis stroyani)]|uniref:NADH-quinone oxidoreductase subunit E n=1 Tax=Buchnera aphidicola (Muscaphis stroyani) TaxID=1241869 RepID=A0A4D6Y5D8_9GAMM|nr:NADH-quinone oxidoreductase subunit NuoE [Buchnera aphidicola (Muscaphis stroyani)]